jgi:beta-lactamase class A
MAGALGAIAIATCTWRGTSEGDTPTWRRASALRESRGDSVGHRFSGGGSGGGAGRPAADSPLQKQISAIAASDGGRVGAAALLIETGERVGVRGGERFPMQSVFKLPVALQVMHEVDAGRITLDQRVTRHASDMRRGYGPIAEQWPRGTTLAVEEMLRLMVSHSDNTAADALMTLAGGPAAVTRRLRELGVSGIRVDRSEGELARDLTGAGAFERYARDPRDTATPDAAADLLVAVWRGGDLTPAAHGRLMTWMTETSRAPKRLKGQLPANTAVAHRPGTGPDNAGVNAATNDIGLITLPDGRHFAVAVFIAMSRQPTEAREAIIARIAKAAYDYWTP